MHWFKYYKTTDGKPVNELASEEPLSREEALKVIGEVRSAYDRLIADPSRMASLGLV